MSNVKPQTLKQLDEMLDSIVPAVSKDDKAPAGSNGGHSPGFSRVSSSGREKDPLMDHLWTPQVLSCYPPAHRVGPNCIFQAY